MPSIDTRVVRMQFDNQQFEKGIKTSMESISDLKKGLDFSGAAKGMDEIQKSSEKVNFSVIGSAVETVKVKFSALEVMAITALQNITNQAIATGEQLLKSLTTDNIAAGWDKYSRKTAATQTIMNATGKSIEEVDEALSKLIWYSDETSYDFVTMVESVGKFTSVGVELEDAVTAMEGIANWAAESGVNTKDAARAFYNLSQAMGSGALKLQDWMSIENLVMGTQKFKEAVVESALKVGTLKDAIDDYVTTTVNGKGETSRFSKDLEGFRDSLSSAWITKDVLMDVLGRYGEYTDVIYELSDAYDTVSEAMAEFGEEGYEFSAQAFKAAQVAKTWTDMIESVQDAVSSKWEQTFELIFGNYEESVELWTDLSNELWEVFAASGDARNEMLGIWKDLGGREALLESFWNIFHGIVDSVNAVKSAWRDVFPPMTGERLAELTEKFRDFTERIKPSEETLDRISRIFKGFFAVLSIVKSVLSPVINLFGTLLSHIIASENEGGGLLEFLAKIGDMLVSISEFVAATSDWGNLVAAFGEILGLGIDTIKSIISDFFYWLSNAFSVPKVIIDWCSNLYNSIKGGILGLFKNSGSVMSEGIQEFVTIVDEDIPLGELHLTDSVRGLVDTLADAGSDLSGKLIFSGKALSDSASESSKIIEDAGTSFNEILDSSSRSFMEATSRASKGLGLSATSITDFVSHTADVTKSAYEKITDSIRDGTATSTTETQSVVTIGLNAIKGFFISAKEYIETNFPGLASLATSIKDAFLGIGSSILNMFKEGDIKGIIDIINSILMTGVLKNLKDFVGSLNNLAEKNIFKSFTGVLNEVKETFKAWQTELKAEAIKKIAVAVGILAASIFLLSFVEKDDLEASVGAITVAMFGLMGVISVFNKHQGGGISAGVMFTSLAVGILIFAGAVAIFGRMKTETLQQGLLAVSSLILVLGALSKLASTIPKDAAKTLSSLGAGLMILAVGLTFLAGPIAIFGHMDLGHLAQGVAIIAGLVLGLWTFCKFISESGIKAMGTIPKFAAGLFLMAIALTALAAPIAIFGHMDITTLWVSLGALASMLVVVAGASKLVKPKSVIALSSALMSLAGAFDILAVGMLLLVPAVAGIVAVGIENFLIVLGSIVVVLAAFGAAAILLGKHSNALYDFSSALIDFGIAMLISAAALWVLAKAANEGAGDAIVTILQAIIDAAPLAGEAVVEIVAAIARAFLGSAAVLTATLMETLYEALKAIHPYIPGIVEEVLLILYDILKAINDNIEPVLEEAFKTIKTIIDKIMEFLGEELDEASVWVFIAATAAFIVLFKMMGSLKKVAKDALIGCGAMLLAVGGIAGVMIAMMAVPFEGALEVAESLAIVLGVMVAAMLLISNFYKSGSIGAVVEAALAIDAFIGIISVVFGAIAALIAGLDAWLGEGTVVGAMEKMVDFFKAIGDAIGGLLGGIIGGIAGGLIDGVMGSITNNLPALGQSLSDFWENARVFVEGASKLETTMMDGVMALIGVIFALTAADVLAGIVAFLGGGKVSWTDFGMELAAFAPYLASFAKELESVDAEKLKMAAEAALALALFADNLPARGGILQDWLGEKESLAQFAEELKKFAGPLVSFSHKVRDLDGEAVETAMISARLLSEFAGSLPNHGGVIQWFTGDATLTTFADELNDFGPSLVDFAKSVAGLTEDSVTGAVAAAQVIAAFEENLPAHGGILQAWTGDQTLTDFSKQLDIFGPALANFANTFAGENAVDAAGAETAVVLAQLISDLDNTLPPTGGIVQMWAGQPNLKEFGAGLVILGGGIRRFVETVGDLNPAAVANASVAGQVMMALADNLPTTTDAGLFGFFFGGESTMSWADMAVGLAHFGGAIAGFVLATGLIPKTAIDNAYYAANVVRGLANNLPTKTQSSIFDFWFGGESTMSWSDLSNGLVGFAVSVRLFIEALGSVDSKASTNAYYAANTVKKLATNLPERDTLVEKIFGGGTKSFSEIGVGLQDFAKAIKGFMSEWGDLDSEKVKDSAEAAGYVEQLINNLPTHASFIEKIFGQGEKMSLSELSEGLSGFGKAIVAFIEPLDKITKQQVTHGAELATEIGLLAEKLPDEHQMGLLEFIFGGERTMSWATLGEEMVSMAGSLVEFAGEVAKIKNIEHVKDSIGAIDAVVTMASTLSTISDFGVFSSFSVAIKQAALDGLNEFADVFDDVDNVIPRAVSNFLGKLTTALRNEREGLSEESKVLYNAIFDEFRIAGNETKQMAWKMQGTIMIGQLNSAFNDDSNKKSLQTSIRGIFDALIDTVNGYKTKFKSAGENVVDGLTEGIEQTLPKVTKAGTGMANRALSALEGTLLIHSPSKATFADGEYLVVGFINGIRSQLGTLDDGMTEFGDTALDNMRHIVEKAAAVVESEGDFTPTITPILDLSQIQNGVTSLNGMMGSRSYGIGASISYDRAKKAASEMTVRSKNDAALVREIRLLREDMANYTNAAENANVYLDGDTLVGSMASRIDKTLGRRAVYAGRRN